MMEIATVKERPMLFSGDMVRAILDGRKTQTRRPVKPQPTHRLIEGLAHVTVGMDPGLDGQVWYDADCVNPGREVRCPFGRVGDRLWVREKWRISTGTQRDHNARVTYADGDSKLVYWMDGHDVHSRVGFIEKNTAEALRWRPSIHMPRWASRITLEITDVRVERVQDIAPHKHKATKAEIESIKAEGFASGRWDEFAHIWDRLYALKGLGWEANPWVWVISFRRIEC